MKQHNTSINNSTGSDYVIYFDHNKYDYARLVFMRILAVIEIPVMILTLIALCFLVKSRPAASVFVGHLILSDLIQVILILVYGVNNQQSTINLDLFGMYVTYSYSLIAGVYFMACVSFERYLLVSHPIWYKSHQSLKRSCCTSVIVWFLPLIFAGIFLFLGICFHIYFISLSWPIVYLIPYIIIILCFVGTWRGLSRSVSLTALKRKLILGSLFLVLLTYTFLILPAVIMIFIIILDSFRIFHLHVPFLLKCNYFSVLLLCVNPLADCMLYLFIRPDVGNMMKSVHCCCKHKQDEHSVVNPLNSCSTVVCCISAQKPESHSLNTCSSV